MCGGGGGEGAYKIVDRNSLSITDITITVNFTKYLVRK